MSSSAAARGSLRLRSADPATHPVIDPGYLVYAPDFDRMIIASQMSLDIAQGDVLTPGVISNPVRVSTRTTIDHVETTTNANQLRTIILPAHTGLAATNLPW
jgi:GMC oxidoreductase